MDQLISWIATVATIIAACMTASNLGSRITGSGFAVFTVGSLAWLALGVMTGQPALVWTNMVLTFLNLFGIWRWLGRQRTIESGAQAAVERSRETPGEALFPVSLLAQAPLAARDGSAIGHCIDAMAGCASGRIGYLVASEGGLAGVGETLRRVPWSEVTVEGETVTTKLDGAAFCTLEPIARDEWPAQ